MRARRRWLVTIGLAALAGLGIAAYFLVRNSGDGPQWTTAPGTVLPGGSCESPESALGFASLPPVREPDFSFAGEIEFGDERHPRVMLLEPDGRRIPLGEDYSVTVVDLSRRTPPTRDWRLSARMLALDASGAVVEEISHDRIPPGGWRGRGEKLTLAMGIGEAPGFYRVDLRVDGAGPRPLRYSLYLEAIAPRAEGRLAIDGRRFRAGESVGVRIENLGSEEIQFGEGVGLGKVVPGGIVPVPEERSFQLWMSGVPGGGVSPCEALQLDPSLAPGRYVIGKSVMTRAEPRGYNHHHLVSTEFEIVD